MEQINNYVEAMFAALPQDADILRIKKEMLDNLDERYTALLREGKNQFEAVGIVLASIGTAEELRAELGLSSPVFAAPENTPSATQVVFSSAPKCTPTAKQTQEYYAFRTKFAWAIAISVALFILSPVVNVFFEEYLHAALLGNFLMFSFVAIGVATLIRWGLRSGYYSDTLGLGGEGRRTALPADDPLIEEYGFFISRFSYALGSAVALFILSPIACMFFEEAVGIELLGLLAMFLMVAIGVGLCIVWGMRLSAFHAQLGFSDHLPSDVPRQARGRFTGLFAGIIFPLAAMLFLYLGFFRNMWHPGWIVFPICGVLTGITGMIEEFVTGKP